MTEMSDIQVTAQKNHMVKKASLTESYNNHHPSIVVDLQCVFDPDGFIELKKTIEAIRKKAPKGYQIEVSLRFFL